MKSGFSEKTSAGIKLNIILVNSLTKLNGWINQFYLELTCVSSQNSPPKCLKFLRFIMFLYEKPVVETNFVGTRLILNYEKIDMNHSGSNHMINDIKGSFCIKIT